jgi:chromosomal replication initiation ATPase DnaA
MNTLQGIRKEKVDAIVNGFCQYYGVKADDLCKSTKGREGILWKWKKYLIPILYDNTDLDFAEIMKILGYKSYPNVTYHYKVIKEEISDELYGSQKIRLNYNELIKFLQL